MPENNNQKRQGGFVSVELTPEQMAAFLFAVKCCHFMSVNKDFPLLDKDDSYVINVAPLMIANGACRNAEFVKDAEKCMRKIIGKIAGGERN